jgi:hypothetical protein
MMSWPYSPAMDTFQCKDGRVVELDWQDDEMIVWTTGDARQRIGNITFRYIEGGAEDGSGDHYLVTNMHLDGPNASADFIGQGIGRQIIRQVGEGMPIVFSADDGNRRDDGSHLTGAGPGFATRMIEEGLASWDT